MNKIKQLTGYYYAVRNYMQTPKGRHDFVDYARAVVVITGVIAAAVIAIKWLSN